MGLSREFDVGGGRKTKGATGNATSLTCDVRLSRVRGATVVRGVSSVVKMGARQVQWVGAWVCGEGSNCLGAPAQVLRNQSSALAAPTSASRCVLFHRPPSSPPDYTSGCALWSCSNSTQRHCMLDQGNLWLLYGAAYSKFGLRGRHVTSSRVLITMEGFIVKYNRISAVCRASRRLKCCVTSADGWNRIGWSRH